ncbi:MAG: ATP phosphoribosyltransferase regulatory subunit, partial [Actinomycetospora chiangmaiensis]|nr:ATP phosphoribosyltransferase regulatory subunit [Actinomycetospora chiangmaiensis]
MTRPEAGETGVGDAARARLSAHLNAAGYRPVTPPVLQPLEPFLELSGEDIRRRIFVTQDAGGAELCLRPEFTIPVCRLHRQRADGLVADYSYSGPVFRLAADEP